jgi:uncharacterized lipoprotein NlpE involved in copper resistance
MSAQLGQATQQLQQTEMTLVGMARQFPAAASSFTAATTGLRQAIVALRAAMKQIMTSPGQSEPPSPAIGG